MSIGFQKILRNMLKIFLGNQKAAVVFPSLSSKTLYLRALSRLGFYVHLTTESHRTRGKGSPDFVRLLFYYLPTLFYKIILPCGFFRGRGCACVNPRKYLFKFFFVNHSWFILFSFVVTRDIINYFGVFGNEKRSEQNIVKPAPF